MYLIDDSLAVLIDFQGGGVYFGLFFKERCVYADGKDPVERKNDLRRKKGYEVMHQWAEGLALVTVKKAGYRGTADAGRCEV